MSPRYFYVLNSCDDSTSNCKKIIRKSVNKNNEIVQRGYWKLIDLSILQPKLRISITDRKLLGEAYDCWIRTVRRNRKSMNFKYDSGPISDYFYRLFRSRRAIEGLFTQSGAFLTFFNYKKYINTIMMTKIVYNFYFNITSIIIYLREHNECDFEYAFDNLMNLKNINIHLDNCKVNDSLIFKSCEKNVECIKFTTSSKDVCLSRKFAKSLEKFDNLQVVELSGWKLDDCVLEMIKNYLI
ncbi:hypothetical protein HCN44_003222 [Aphidius gifuensis]|uniref:Uncharacterized protein n=1 Tax=Aphidius gifuensis TaxID=684658 RepID=A0A834XLB3_APHGI|nr:hypothetical protein HCN44_003222 [Aphidius gifuensis]